MSSDPASMTPLSAVRRVIAERMMASLHGSAQLSYHADADVTDLLRSRQNWKTAGRAAGIEDCAIRAFARALSLHPEINCVFDGTAVRYDPAVHVAIAVATPGGLMTPVLRDADTKPIEVIAVERADLVERARAGRLKVSDMKGATATLSNLGKTRVRHFTPILNGGQACLLGLGRIEPRVALDAGGAVTERHLMGLSLTADHRVVDGWPAGQFLTTLCGLLEAFDDG
jgi:pyruvate/2-oxoglutarate dehydrogenase complex dihydrolipoamide acyltransferase (E2) component